MNDDYRDPIISHEKISLIFQNLEPGSNVELEVLSEDGSWHWFRFNKPFESSDSKPPSRKLRPNNRKPRKIDLVRLEASFKLTNP